MSCVSACTEIHLAFGAPEPRIFRGFDEASLVYEVAVHTTRRNITRKRLMRVAICLCPPSPQSTLSQRLALWGVAARSFMAIAGVFVDSGSGDSPGLDELFQMIARREVDAVLAWDANCLSRSLLDAISVARCGLFAREGTSPPDAEPDTPRTRAQGKRLGRPRVDSAVEQTVRSLLDAGRGIRATAREAGVGISVVQRVRAERLGHAGLA